MLEEKVLPPPLGVPRVSPKGLLPWRELWFWNLGCSQLLAANGGFQTDLGSSASSVLDAEHRKGEIMGKSSL